MFQRRRGRKGDFTGDFVAEWAHLVHMLPIVPKAQDHAREATAGEKAASVESASNREETFRGQRNGGGNRPAIETAKTRMGLRVSMLSRFPLTNHGCETAPGPTAVLPPRRSLALPS
jgi:hypothetical protein